MDIPEDVLNIWDKYNLPENVRRHCIKVAEVALKIAEKIKERGHNIDLELVKKGALLHDIGRAITHDPFKHFIMSGDILRKEGFDNKIVKIVERHFSAGVTKDEAVKLRLPVIDNFMPETLEEKIVCYADKIVKGDREITFEQFLKRLDELKNSSLETKWFTEITKERVIKLKQELETLAGTKL
ncbi:MAG TPA: TIGR00295 family protein [Archaeoglobus profundus]|nr:TIGR00295 family protein [Archaeoglobus profundus]HIP58536.1 TIGR00295 family protein [Archaeoglobus profundus]